jgi:hypothetical protein
MDDEALAKAGLTQEWGVRRQTHVGLVDSWYCDWLTARTVWEDEEAEGAAFIYRFITATVVVGDDNCDCDHG